MPAIIPLCILLFSLQGASAPSAKVESLSVMTFNLRFDSAQDPHRWSERLPAVASVIRDSGAQLVGTQEGLYHQVRSLEKALPGYAWIGLGREGGSRGEFMAVYYSKERLEPLEFDHFWLSDTPEVVGSTSWGNSVRRMVTWVRFRDRTSGSEFVCLNTHLDHQVAESRLKSAQLIRERSGRLYPDLPLIVLGDFNALAGDSEPWQVLAGEDGPLEDTWNIAQERGPLVTTFHGWDEIRTDGLRIDWILVRGVPRVAKTSILTARPDGMWPSDHFPVLAVLELDD